jgi:hypothetical protein
MDFDEFTDTKLFFSLKRGYEGEELYSVAKKCWENCLDQDVVDGAMGFNAGSVITAFTWMASEEGEDYWRKVWLKT